MKAWLLRTTWGFARWRLLVCTAAAIAVAVVLWNPLGAIAGLLALVRPARRVDPVDWTPDPGPPAQDAHHAATETDAALRGVQAESSAREAAGARAAAGDRIEDVVARVERRAKP